MDYDPTSFSWRQVSLLHIVQWTVAYVPGDHVHVHTHSRAGHSDALYNFQQETPVFSEVYLTWGCQLQASVKHSGPKGNLVYHTEPNSHMFGNFRSGFNHKGYIPRKVGQGFLKQS